MTATNAHKHTIAERGETRASIDDSAFLRVLLPNGRCGFRNLWVTHEGFESPLSHQITLATPRALA
jgi:hypothetical protein